MALVWRWFGADVAQVKRGRSALEAPVRCGAHGCGRPSGHNHGLYNPQPESPQMSNAIAAHKHRTMLHVLRDRVQRAQRDEKRGMAGAAERVAAHTAKRAAYRAANP